MKARARSGTRLLVGSKVYRYTDSIHRNGEIAVIIPLMTDGSLTQRKAGHWAAILKRSRQQQALVDIYMRPVRDEVLAMGVTHVTLARIAPRKLDMVQLWSAMKHVQDAIARLLGRDDAQWKDGAIKWEVEQRSEAPRTYGVEIRLWNCSALPETTTHQTK